MTPTQLKPAKRRLRRSFGRGGRATPRPSGRGQKASLSSVTAGKHPKLKIIPLGGMEEVGKNMTVFEYGNDIVILDMGLKFPEEDQHGIDYIIPNISCLKGKEKNVRAVIFSHGHLDHIGASPILLARLGYPTIVGRPLTLAMVKHRQEDYEPKSSNRLKTITIKSLSDRFSFGAFRVAFFQIEHSIMDAVGVILETPAGSVIHPGDWTLERDARSGNPIVDYRHLARVKRPSILMLESLGAIDVRKSGTQDEMKKNLETLIRTASGRIIIGTFASQIERIGWIIQAAERLNKKVALDGYSMKMNIEIATTFGYIKARKGTLI
ncbi:MAG: ribonuclease J [Parcubacteria group bacterium]|nr:ribonuclease J [Parcubacteria group bacterium]